MRPADSKILPLTHLEKVCAQLREERKRIVTTNGCFDLLHWGHMDYLSRARYLGDVLIVGVNSDASVRGLKGPSRPIHEESIRLRQVASLEVVDFVVLFSEPTPMVFLKAVKPWLHVKGGDYDPATLPERPTVEEGGGTVQCLPLVAGFSTTKLLQGTNKEGK